MNYAGLRQHNWQTFLANTTAGSLSDDVIQKAQYDTGLNSGAMVNDVYGAIFFAQYNSEHNWLNAIPVVDRTDATVGVGDTVNPKAFRAAHSPVALQTHSEGGSVPSGNNFTPEEVSFEVKRSETVAEMSDLQQIESMLEDAAGWEEVWELQQEQLDLAIDRDALAAPVNTSDPAYDSEDNLTKLDRAIASQDEENNADDTDDNAYSDGDLDYGTIDRSTDSWADSYVDHNGTSGNRQLTRDLMDDFLANLGDNGDADPYEEGVILTTRNTAKVLSDLMADSGRGTRITFDGDGSGRDDVNDAETLMGLAGTTRFRHYDEIPIIPNQNGPEDGIGRIFVVSLGTIRGEPRIALEQFAEPYVETAGRGQAQGYIAQGNYQEKALFLQNHELVVRDFSSHGKLRDLAE